MNNSNSDDLMDNDEWAFSLADVVDFFQEAWKTLLGGALAGLALAVLGWLAVGKYTAESVMVNNPMINQSGERHNTKNEDTRRDTGHLEKS